MQVNNRQALKNFAVTRMVGVGLWQKIGYTCPTCGSFDVIPTNSPRARRRIAEINSGA
jgi:hypothetical protein